MKRIAWIVAVGAVLVWIAVCVRVHEHNELEKTLKSFGPSIESQTVITGPHLDLSELLEGAQTTVDVDKLPGYDDLVDAGVHAIAAAYKCSHVYECGGIIGKRLSDGKYIVGRVYSDRQGDSLMVHHNSRPGVTLVADFHTHPCLAATHDVEFFSPDDMAEAEGHHVISFMGSLCDGAVHMYDYRTMRANEEPSDDPGTWLTRGLVVGHIAVDGKSVEPNEGFL